MTHTDRLKRSPKAFRQLTGLTPAAFDQLLAELEPRHEHAEHRRKTRRPRPRKPEVGRKHKLALADRSLMLLIYYRTYTTHVFLGFLFGIDDSAVGRNINPLQPLLAGIVRIPERKVTLEPDEIRELFFDATEQAIPRPSRRQKRFYSGKKRRHTVKHQVVVVRKRKRRGQPRRVRIAAVSAMFPGTTHDKKVYDRTRVVVPPPGCRGRETRPTWGRAWTRRPGDPGRGNSRPGRRPGTAGCRGGGSWWNTGSGR
jgi:hypothetical protein